MQLGLPSLTTDTAAKIMAVLYVYGNNENMVLNTISKLIVTTFRKDAISKVARHQMLISLSSSNIGLAR